MTYGVLTLWWNLNMYLTKTKYTFGVANRYFTKITKHVISGYCFDTFDGRRLLINDIT